MTAATMGIEGALGALHRGAGEMSLRAWMEANREALLDAWKGRRLNWQALCPWFAEVGLTNAKGETASIACAKRIWHRVGKVLKDRRDREQMQAEAAIVAKAAKRDALLAQRAREAVELEEAASARAAAERELEIRQIAKLGFPPAPVAPSVAPVAATLTPVPKQAPAEATLKDDASSVVIGQIKRPVKMLEAAPRYGEDRFRPLPPAYVGPRPPGMPENLPLEALTPLDATGMTPDGKVDFRQMPGLPRMSFFERESDWARACVPMIEAVPLEKRSLPLKAMLLVVKGYARNF